MQVYITYLTLESTLGVLNTPEQLIEERKNSFKIGYC